MIEQKQNGAASIDIADILVAILTSAALPVVSHMLTLVFGDSSLWSVDRLMVLYFSSFSGWITREFSACNGTKWAKGQGLYFYGL